MASISTGLGLLLGGALSAGGSVAAGLSSKQTTPTMTPTGQALDTSNSNYLQSILSDPQAGLGPVASAGTQAIDSSYAGSADAISRMMASRGYGSSGNMGNTMYQTDLSRLGSLSNFSGQMAQLESQRQMQASGDMNQLIGINTGNNQSTPGAGLANGLLSAGSSFSNLSIMSMLQAMLSGGGGGGGLGGVGGLGQTPSGTPTLINSTPGNVGGPTINNGGGTTEDLGW